MNEEKLGLKYFPENFNFMFSVLHYVFERERVPSFKDSIYNLIKKIEAAHQWKLEDRLYIVVEMNASDLSIVNYCYEDVLIDSFEAQSKRYGNTDYFRIMYAEDVRRGEERA